MRVKLALLISMLLLTGGLAEKVGADVDIGLSFGEDGIKGFYLAIGDYYRVSQKEVLIVKKNDIPDEDLSVIFFLARKAGVAPQVIIDLRLGGSSWMDITFHLGLNSKIYYVPVKEVKGPPYGKAYGHFKNKPKNKWKDIRLKDDEVVNFVNLRFMMEYHDYSADEVIKMRAKGKSFFAINDEIKKAKKEQKMKSSKKSTKAKSGKKKK